MKLSLSNTQIGTAFSLSAAFLFSIKAIFIKQAYALSPLVDGTTLLAIRMACALPFFLLICWFTRQQNKNIASKDWLMLIVAGLLGYYFASWLDFIGLMYINASLERIILFLYPTLTVLASSFIYRNALSVKSWLAILLSYGGTVLVMLAEQHNTSLQGNFWLGSSLVFASAVAFAVYLLMTPPLIRKFGSWNFTGLAMSVACLGTILHYLLLVATPIQRILALPGAALWYGAALGFLITVLPTVFLMQGIARLGASQSAMIASIGPILTVILAVAFLNEHLNTLQWLGCILNMGGVMMITLAKKKLSH